ncbi:MAG: hypothetical protein INF89_19315 [Roseomonas sp.]|nr:hypothetical protein [Roseomonas sp.]
MNKRALPAWSIQIRENGDKVTLVRDKERQQNVLEFQRNGNATTIVLSDAALSAVVILAVNRAGVPVIVDQTND